MENVINIYIYIYIYNTYNLRIIYCFNLLMIIPTLQKNTITEIYKIRKDGKLKVKLDNDDTKTFRF